MQFLSWLLFMLFLFWRKNEGMWQLQWVRRESADGSFGREGLIDETICCPQLAVATPMGLEILTHFDNVSVELYPWLCAACV